MAGEDQIKQEMVKATSKIAGRALTRAETEKAQTAFEKRSYLDLRRRLTESIAETLDISLEEVQKRASASDDADRKVDELMRLIEED